MIGNVLLVGGAAVIVAMATVRFANWMLVKLDEMDRSTSELER